MPAKKEQILYTNGDAFGMMKDSSYSAIGSVGGQFGVTANPLNFDASTPLAFNPSILLVLQTPTMFDYNPAIGKAIKELIETCPKSVSGIDFGYTVQTAEAKVGWDDQTIKAPTKTTRSQVSPSFTFNEVAGSFVWKLIFHWIKNLNHPDSNSAFMDAIAHNQKIPQFVLSSYSMTMLAIQYDPSMAGERILDAALYMGMFPTETTPFGFERAEGGAQIKERAIPFTGIVRHNDKTRLLAKKLSDAMNAHKINFDQIDSGNEDVSQTIKSSGFQQHVEEIKSTASL